METRSSSVDTIIDKYGKSRLKATAKLHAAQKKIITVHVAANCVSDIHYRLTPQLLKTLLQGRLFFRTSRLPLPQQKCGNHPNGGE